MHSCPQCQSTDLFAMDLTIGAEPVRFLHCRACEHRWWVPEGSHRVLALSDVLSR